MVVQSAMADQGIALGWSHIVRSCHRRRHPAGGVPEFSSQRRFLQAPCPYGHSHHVHIAPIRDLIQHTPTAAPAWPRCRPVGGWCMRHRRTSRAARGRRIGSRGPSPQRTSSRSAVTVQLSTVSRRAPLLRGAPDMADIARVLPIIRTLSQTVV